MSWTSWQVRLARGPDCAKPVMRARRPVVGCGQALVRAEAEPFDHTRPEALDMNIGLLHETDALGTRDVDGDAPPATAHQTQFRLQRIAGVRPARTVKAEHRRANVGQHHPAEGGRAARRVRAPARPAGARSQRPPAVRGQHRAGGEGRVFREEDRRSGDLLGRREPPQHGPAQDSLPGQTGDR